MRASREALLAVSSRAGVSHLFFCERLESKYFRLCRSHMVSVINSLPPHPTNTQKCKKLLAPGLYKDRLLAGFGPQAVTVLENICCLMHTLL